MPIKSDYPDVEIDERQFAIQFMERVELHARNAQKIAIIDADNLNNPITYRNLRLYIVALADFLHEHDFGHKSVASIIAPNCSQFAIAFGAVMLCGGATSGVSCLFLEEEIRTQLLDCGASVVFCHESLLQKTRNAARQCPKFQILIVITDTPKEIELEENEYLLCNLFKRNTTMKNLITNVDVKKEPILIPYSSGTTGLSKGVIISHYNLSTVCASYDYMMKKVIWPRGCKNYVPEHETIILFLPLYHVYGIFMLLQCLMDGTQLVLMKQFNGDLFCSLVQKFKPKMQNLVPPLVNFLASHPLVDKYDMSSITLIISAAAPLSPELIKKVKQRFRNIRYVSQAYGMTELTAMSHFPYLADIKMNAGAVGKLGPNLELKIVCPQTGEELRLDKMGEICIKGPIVMVGYLNNEEATRQIMDDRGFLHTGDLGYVDSHTKVLHIVDRLKELIKVSGRQVAPAELENILMTHRLVADCAVIGIEDPKCGELPKAFVVLKPDPHQENGTVSEDQLAKFVDEQVAPFKHLKGGIEFCDSIPKSAAGKILRRVLRDQNKN